MEVHPRGHLGLERITFVRLVDKKEVGSGVSSFSVEYELVVSSGVATRMHQRDN